MDLKRLLFGKHYGLCMLCNKKIKLSKAVFSNSYIALCEKCNKNIKLAPFAHLYPGTDTVSFIISPLYYTGVIRYAILDLKFNENRHISDVLNYYALTYLSTFEDENLFDYIDEIIPVPLSKSRLTERGYNQAEIIAKAISEKYNIPLNTSSLLKIKNTKPQSSLSREQRNANLQGAYSCDDAVNGKRIMLVDDVYTTGNTLEACAKELSSHGASSICAFTLTHGSAPTHSREYFELFS